MAHGYTDAGNLAVINQWLDDRSDAMLMLDCIAFTAKKETFANLETLGNSINNEWHVILENVASPSLDFEKASAVMGGFAFTQNQGIGNRVVPFQAKKIAGILPAKKNQRFNEAQRNSLLYNGISTFYEMNGFEYTDQLITTYKENQFGGEDWSYLYPETLEGLRYLRWDTVNYLRNKYPNRVIGEEGVKYGPGNTNVITLSSLKNDLIGRAFSVWLLNNLINNPEEFKELFIIETNSTNANRIDMRLVPTIAKGLRQIAGKISFK
jgi:phage tail sheath gpL-like